MTAMRRGDKEAHPRFRESRFFHSMEQWFFLTREGFVEGPFDNRGHAEQVLQAFLREVAKE
jgi:hypothetical protein